MTQLTLNLEPTSVPSMVESHRIYLLGKEWNGFLSPDHIYNGIYHNDFLRGMQARYMADHHYMSWWNTIRSQHRPNWPELTEFTFYEDVYLQGLLSDESDACPFTYRKFVLCWHIGRLAAGYSVGDDFYGRP